MTNIIELKADSFKYPTLEERRKIKDYKPKIDRLKIEHKPAILEILQGGAYDSAVREEDIFWWCECLNNRLGKMDETFIYVQTHYLRVQEGTSNESGNTNTDRILLDYYVEIFYYYFFSTRDVLGQLLNIFYGLNFEEKNVFLNEKFAKEISSERTKDALIIFLNNTKDSYVVRNSFNHRFTPNHKDFRAKNSIIKEDKEVSVYSASEIEIQKFVNDIENLIKHLAGFMSELANEIR